MKVRLVLFVFSVTFLFDAEQLHAKSLKTNELSGLKEELGRSVSLAHQYQFSHPDSTLIHAKNAIYLAEEVDELMTKADMLILIGLIMEKQGNHELALQYLYETLDIYTSENATEEVAKTKVLLSRVCADARFIESAKQHIQEAIAYYQQTKNTSELARSTCNLAYAYEREDSTKLALQYYQKADSINQISKNGDLDILITEALGSVYEDMKRYDLAMLYYTKVLPMYEGKIFEKIDAINNIGDVNRKSGKPEKALPYYHKAYKLASDNKFNKKIQQNARDLALTYAALKMYDSAFHYSNLQFALYTDIFDETRINNVQQMQILYESDKKSKEIALQRARASSTAAQRNMVIIVLIVICIACFLIWRNARQKSIVNKTLNQQNKKIQKHQQALQQTNEELHKILNELKSTQDQLVHAEKMATVGTLTAGIAHEINNPLNFINGGITALKGHYESQQNQKDPNTEKLIESILEGAKRATNIVKSLNRFSYKNEELQETCDVHNIIENCLVMLQHSTKNRITIEKKYASDSLACKGNEGNLHQVFLNVLVNATQAIEGEGQITISTSMVGDNIVVLIKDSGSGISKENISKITDPFFTTKEPGKGTGLGLSISQKIIKEHRGKLEFKSERLGTEVTITLPVQQA